MKTTVISSVIFAAAALIHGQAQAIYIPGNDRPVLEARNFEVFQTSPDISSIKGLELTMTRRDAEKDPTGFTVVGDIFKGKEKFKLSLVLNIEEIETDSCGSTIYYASLPHGGDDYQILPTDAQQAGHRVNLVLEDHSTRLCKDYKPYTWEMELRMGYGFCGTQDSVIEAGSNPEPVYTIQQYLPEI